MTTMPPLSQTKMDVGIVSSPGCSKTIRGFRRSPSTSQIAVPNARAPAVQVANAAASRQSGITPQWENSLLSMKPRAPRSMQYCPRSGPDVTATGIAPLAFAIWIACEPRPPEPPQIRTTAFSATGRGGHEESIRYAVAPTSVHAAAAAQLRCGDLGSSWCAWTSVYWAKLPQLVSYPQIRALGAMIGSPPEVIHGSAESQTPQWATTWSPTRTPSTPSPTAQTMPEASLPPMWKSSLSPAFRRAATTSTGRPSAAQTLL